MRWFKHYSDATTSDGLSRIILELGFEGYGRYWALLEFLAFKFDGEDTTFTIHPAIVRETLRIRSWNKLRTFLERIGNVRGMEVEWSENEIKFNAPILLDLKSRDFRNTRTEREQTACKRKNKNKIKIESKNTYVTAYELLEFWNGLGLKQQDPLPEVLRSISDAFTLRESFGVEGNKQAFANYARVVKDPATWWTSVFSCVNFLKNSGTLRFYPSEFNADEYKKTTTRQAVSADQKLEKTLSMENPYATN